MVLWTKNGLPETTLAEYTVGAPAHGVPKVVAAQLALLCSLQTTFSMDIEPSQRCSQSLNFWNERFGRGKTASDSLHSSNVGEFVAEGPINVK